MAKFLSKQNLEHIYNYLKTDLESINIKLDEDKKYRKAVKTMMRSIGNQQEESGKQLSVDNLNVYAVSKIKPFLVEMFKKISDNNIYVCGGGRKNQFLIDSIQKKIKKKIQKIDTVGIDGDFIESQAFGYLAIRSYLGLPISFPKTTGCKEPSIGGVLANNY